MACKIRIGCLPDRPSGRKEAHQVMIVLDSFNSLCRPMASRAAERVYGAAHRPGQYTSTEKRTSISCTVGQLGQYAAYGHVVRGTYQAIIRPRISYATSLAVMRERGRFRSCDGQPGGTTNWGGACDISLHVEFLNEVTLASLHRRSLVRGPPGL